MKASIQIPKGYRRLRRGEILRSGDMFLDVGHQKWAETICAGGRTAIYGNFCIHRIKRAPPVQSQSKGKK